MAVGSITTEAFTDVMLRCSDRWDGFLEITGHAAILSAKSEKFRTMLEDDQAVQQGSHTILKFSDAHCLVTDYEIMIKHIYTSRYIIYNDDKWEDHVRCARLAKIFALPEMEAKALTAFRELLQDCTLEYVADVLRERDGYEYTSDRFEKTVAEMRDRHLLELANIPRLAVWTLDPKIMEFCLDGIVQSQELDIECERCHRYHTVSFKEKQICSGCEKHD